MERLLDGNETAQRLGCTRRHLERLLAQGDAPPSVRLGRLRRFSESALDTWIAQRVEAAAPASGRRSQSNAA
jgi:excisionase family DNA binding protein